MKVPKVVITSFFLVFFLASLLAQARILQENYQDDMKAKSSDYHDINELFMDYSQSFLERFNGAIVTFMSSLSSKEFGKGALSPPPSPKPSDPQNPTFINPGEFSPTLQGMSGGTLQDSAQGLFLFINSEEFGRGPKSPPPPPKPSDPEHPIIITGEFGRERKPPPPAPKPLNPDHPRRSPRRSPPPAPKPSTPIHPGGGEVISMAEDSSENHSFVASA